MVPPDVHTHDDVVDEELARKKRELEQLNELIARKRAIAAMEPKVAEMKREVEKTCFDYDHGRIALADLKPTTDYKPVPVKSILKKRTDGITGLLFPIKVFSNEFIHYRKDCFFVKVFNIVLWYTLSGCIKVGWWLCYWSFIHCYT